MFTTLLVTKLTHGCQYKLLQQALHTISVNLFLKKVVGLPFTLLFLSSKTQNPCEGRSEVNREGASRQIQKLIKANEKW